MQAIPARAKKPAMRVLGIETSSRRGSVALVEQGRLVHTAMHERDSSHAELILPLIAELLAQAGWTKSSLDRVAVGVGPGAFTGIRIGIALAQGIGLALGRPVFGVGSLEAMAAAVPRDLPGLRCALLDARRSELFVGVYSPEAVEIAAPGAVGRDGLHSWLEEIAPEPRLIVGEIGAELGAYRSPETDLPHALWTARIGELRSEEHARAEPRYVRDAGATLPELPPSPFSSGVDAERTSG
jgi:tRNA threonylcarbamoyladenosine biosynthesis protein TsaB